MFFFLQIHINFVKVNHSSSSCDCELNENHNGGSWSIFGLSCHFAYSMYLMQGFNIQYEDDLVKLETYNIS